MNTEITNCLHRPTLDPPVELTPPIAAPFRSTGLSELEQLRHRLLRHELAATESHALYPLLRRAANEAAALAGTTAYPLLVLPLLFEEKIWRARRAAPREVARSAVNATPLGTAA